MFFLFSFVLGVSFNFLETSAFPLFLGEFNAQTLPYIYMINAIVVTLITTLYLRLGRRVPFTRLLSVNLGFLLLLLVLFRVGLANERSSAVVFSLPILFQIVVTLGNIAYWTLAGRVFNVRQAKRLFGLLSAGMWTAIVITGFIIPAVVRRVGAANLLVISALGMAVAFGFLLALLRVFGAHLSAAAPAKKEESQRSAADLLRNRYVVFIFLLTVVGWIASFFVDNIFYNRVEAQFASPEQVAGFLGIYLAILGILTLIITTFVSAPVISRYGVGIGLMVLPIALLGGTVLFAGTGILLGIVPILFVFATLNKLLDLSLGFSIDQAAQTILYQPLPPRQRSSVQTIDEGMVRMGAIGVAGVLLVLLNNVVNANVVQLSYALFLFVVAWIGVGMLVRREYPHALMHALIKRKLTGTTLELDDESSLSVLRRAATSSHPGVVVYSLDMLEASAPAQLEETLPALLAHPAPEVRQEAVARIERLRFHALRPALCDRLAVESSPEVRSAGLHTLAVLDEPDLLTLVSADLASPNLDLQRGALAALLIQGGPDASALAETHLLNLARSADPARRLAAAKALADAPDDLLARALVPLLDDPAVAVRKAALTAAGRADRAWLWPRVAQAVARPAVRSVAAAALVRGGAAALPAIQDQLADPECGRETVIRLARVCGRVGLPAAIALLTPLLSQPDPAVRAQAATALERCQFQVQGEPRAQIEARIDAEASHAAGLLACQCDLDTFRPPDDVGYVLDALQNAFSQTQLRMLTLLSFLYDAETLRRVRASLAHPEAEQRAYAVEALDVTLDAATKAQVLPLFESLDPVARLGRLHKHHPQQQLSPERRLQAMAEDADVDRWVRICAVHALGKHSLSGESSAYALAQALQASDPLLRETAGWALRRMDESTIDACKQMLERARGPGEREPGYPDLEAHFGGAAMLSTVEKVIILKTVALFEDTPDEVLADVASVLEEVELPEGVAIFEKGESGDSMYLIVSGEVRVHDGLKLINILGEGEVFGEMALLDPEPRMAAVTATEDTRLLRLAQEPFLELLEDRIDVTRGVIRVLTERLRDCVDTAPSPQPDDRLATPV